MSGNEQGQDPHTFVYLWGERFLFAAPGIHRQPTQRYSVNLLLSVGGEPLQFDAGIHGAGDFRGLLVAPNVRRSMTVSQGGFVSLNVDPESPAFPGLAARLGSAALLPLDRERFEPLLPDLNALLAGRCNEAQAFELSEQLIVATGAEATLQEGVDLRIVRVAQVLRTELPMTPPVRSLAASVGLSESHLMHLFSRQMRIPMKSYVLWARMRRATFLIQSGLSLTEVAHRVGFADQAHFSRTFLGFFGLNPSLLNRSRDVQVFLADRV